MLGKSPPRHIARALWGTASELAFYGIENMNSPALKMKTQNRELSINQDLIPNRVIEILKGG